MNHSFFNSFKHHLYALKMKISSTFYDVDTGDIGNTLGIQSLTQTEFFGFMEPKYPAFRR